MANERSASAANLRWDGVEINHQFSKSLRGRAAARGCRRRGGRRTSAASRCCAPPPSWRSRARSRGMERYHARVHELQRDLPHRPGRCARSSWCRDCPKCRFVFLALAPFSSPGAPRARSSAPTCSPTSRSSRASRCWRRREGTSRSSASARSRRASPRCACSPTTRAGASTRSCGGSRPRCCPRTRRPRATPSAVLALSDEHEVPPSLLDDRACGSRSLTARASASGAPAARSRSFAAQLERRLPGARIGVAAFDEPPGEDVAACAALARSCASSRPATRRRRSRSATSSCARPASRSTAPSCASCRDAGIPVTTATSLWIAEREGRRVIGVTGTKGKSTTAALACHLARAAGHGRGARGNIGRAGARPARRRPPTCSPSSSCRATSSPTSRPGPRWPSSRTCSPSTSDWHGSEQRLPRRTSCGSSPCRGVTRGRAAGRAGGARR